MRERTYREKLRGAYHLVLAEIARHIAQLPAHESPTKPQIEALKDYYRARFHHGRSTEELSDQALSDLITAVEADAACRWRITLPERQYRQSTRAAAQHGAHP